MEHALLGGRRGLPAGGSLAQLLDAHRGTHRTQNTTPLTERQILSWADAWRKRHGAWPITESGDIPESKGDTWRAVCIALRQGYRGLRGGMSLAQFLALHRGVRNLADVPPLSEEKILSWADAHLMRHGRYPTKRSGAVEDAPGETWGAITLSLIVGKRGLRGGVSLAQLLAAHRGVRNRLAAPALSEGQILAWADSYFARHGKWPAKTSGPIDEAPGETWSGIAWALRKGRRGLPGGSSLTDLFVRHRRKANRLVSCVSAIVAATSSRDRCADERRPLALADSNARKRPRIRLRPK